MDLVPFYPQKALCGGIPDPYLEPLTRSLSHFGGHLLPKVDRLSSKLTFEIHPRRALRGYEPVRPRTGSSGRRNVLEYEPTVLKWSQLLGL